MQFYFLICLIISFTSTCDLFSMILLSLNFKSIISENFTNFPVGFMPLKGVPVCLPSKIKYTAALSLLSKIISFTGILKPGNEEKFFLSERSEERRIEKDRLCQLG